MAFRCQKRQICHLSLELLFMWQKKLERYSKFLKSSSWCLHWCFRKANQIPHHLTQMYLSSFHKTTLDEKSTQSNITKEKLHKTKQHHHDFHRHRKGEDFVFTPFEYFKILYLIDPTGFCCQLLPCLALIYLYVQHTPGLRVQEVQVLRMQG